MATLQELMDNLKTKREGLANQTGPFAKTLEKTVGGMQVVATALDRLQLAVKDQIAANAVANRAGQATDVQQSIRELLNAKVAEDKIERERHQRMMDMAESLIPQVTEEQLKAYRMQQLVYREHKKTLEATIAIEEKKAAIQKKNEEEIAKRRIKVIENERAEANFAIKDKYGTIESAIAGFGNSGGDSLGKFLVAGLGRYVKEKKETPIAEAVKEKYDAQVQRQNDIANNRKAQIDKTLGYKKEDINEEFAIRAAKNGISDPGSAAKLYSDRAQQVKAVAKEGETFEKQLLMGKASFGVPKMEQAVKEVAAAIRAKSAPKEVPTLTKEGVVSSVNDATAPSLPDIPKPAETTPQKVEATKQQATTTKPAEAKPAPKNAKFEKAGKQTTRPNGPTKQRVSPTATVNRPVSTGLFGSKGGFVNAGAAKGAMGGITKALGGIVGKLGSLAGSALKFLGPWGMVASAIMSFDRLVPIFSGLAGAIMDMTKLIMPFIVSSILELSAQAMAGFNGLINLFDHAPLIGPHWTEKKPVTSALEKTRAAEAERLAKKAETKRQQAQGGVTVDTTSAQGAVTVSRKESALTTPAEAEATLAQARESIAKTPTEGQSASIQEQREQNQALRDSVLAAAKNPGTTPVYGVNPYVAPWAV